tara:strand:+ start:849 stop:1079 length:231 start_codon:yes stop_codon:yes gene_type:complete
MSKNITYNFSYFVRKNETYKAIQEASVSVACLLDDVAVNHSGELNLSELQKDIEHIQDVITKIENNFDDFGKYADD